ncbi:RHS repeat-associated core domain-containing protein [Chitinophaga costaii]|uniref:RHS repeat-associated core domain-containing protein n=1 Tax=Chitinophaga costaii TaxID=1335309 RepID=A0A1C4G9B3_9BACT|nr:RHS repeat-associated core domain-containing protein [Chitinophaga costaii]PUZ19246.1 hypothetical protein DCM91_20770 [Chitinophaga costaii]SCC64734.1 RHS repeat-associated core domain-containing protein [Chitinophaga costaii]
MVESQADMDRLSYIYPKDNNGQLTANRLRHIQDGVSGSNYANKDLVNQAADNYHYDNIGNLTADPANGVSQIQWTVYGKISHITKTNGDALKYTYDATGNRIYKEYISGGVTSRTWYARDAQGNTLAVYGNKNGDSQVYWNEQDLYGSSRLGTWQAGITLTAGAGATAWSQEGLSRYELTNHLGNVLSTISDQRVGVDNDHNGAIDYYLPTIASYSDYTPFGMQMVDRNGSTGGYRYGFNGKENDNEVKGDGNQQDYGMRVYDPRVGRFLSVDPLTKTYPWWSPYAFAGNSPIVAVDLDGLEIWIPRLIPLEPILTLPKPGTITVPLPPGEIVLPPVMPSLPRDLTVGQPKRMEASEGANLPIDWTNPPASPGELSSEWEDITHPSNKSGSRDFLNNKTKEKIRWDPRKDGAPGWEGKDHWHRYNPNSSNKGDYYLDKSGNPVPKGSGPSHIGMPKMLNEIIV